MQQRRRHGLLGVGTHHGKKFRCLFFGGAGNPWVPKGWGGVTHGCPKVGKYIKSGKKGRFRHRKMEDVHIVALKKWV